MFLIITAIPIISLVLVYFWAHTFPSSLKVDLQQPLTLSDVIKSYVRMLVKKSSRSHDFPALEISAPLTYSAEHLQSYKKQLQIDDSKGDDILPPFYLTALTTGFFLLVSGHPKYPIKMLGVVNTSTEVKVHEPVQKKWLENGELKATATMGQVQEIPKGVEFEIVVKVNKGDRVVWSMIFRCLKFKKTQSTTPSKHYRREEEVIGNSTLLDVGSVKLPADAGRTYAKLSYDINPIHIHNGLAKLFGFPKAIAHGMWAVQQADAKGKQLIRRDVPQAIKVFFKKPSFLPADLTVSVFKDEKTSDVGCFKVERLDKKKDNTVVMYGSVTRL